MYRALFVLVVLALSFAIAYLPGQPGPVSADNGDVPTPTLEPAPTDPPAQLEATPQPTADPATEPSLEPSPLPTVAAEPSPSASPDPAAAPLAIERFKFAHVSAPEEAVYLDPGAALSDEPRFEVFRLRFEVLNASGADLAWTPLLLFGAAGTDVFEPLPVGGGLADGTPFYAAPEWINAGAGTKIGPAYLTDPDNTVDPAVARSMGVNPMPELTLHADSRQTVEFSVRATAGAAYGAAYEFRLTDGGTPIDATVARVEMGAKPALELTPGQRSGVPGDAGNSAVRFATRFALELGATSVHSPSYDLASDSCAACHRAHAAAGSMLTASASELGLCGSCHNGTDLPDIATAFSSVPNNDEASRSYYKHDATDLCAECHNPHDSNSVPGYETAAGWTASGRTYGASGASVTNGVGGPTYQLVPRVTLEYELCFKCHSGADPTPPDNQGQPPSRQLLDAGVEFDPANLSFHPIEAQGTNQTMALNNSLSIDGTSPFKLWAFDTTSTIRCVNCHSDARIASAALESHQPLLASANLPAHASPERGILLASYQNRTLKGALEPYSAANFALCYLCHAEAPFKDQTGNVRTDTNFRYHGIHLSNPDVMRDRGFPGTDIDTPGYGSGFALCAECHFRIHSSAFPADGRDPGPRLVNFAPNVTAPTGSSMGWTPISADAPGTCTLKCHGAPHTGVTY